jgi:hypothetical protein
MDSPARPAPDSDQAAAADHHDASGDPTWGGERIANELLLKEAGPAVQRT